MRFGAAALALLVASSSSTSADAFVVAGPRPRGGPPIPPLFHHGRQRPTRPTPLIVANPPSSTTAIVTSSSTTQLRMSNVPNWVSTYKFETPENDDINWYGEDRSNDAPTEDSGYNIVSASEINSQTQYDEATLAASPYDDGSTYTAEQRAEMNMGGPGSPGGGGGGGGSPGGGGGGGGQQQRSMSEPFSPPPQQQRSMSEPFIPPGGQQPPSPRSMDEPYSHTLPQPQPQQEQQQPQRSMTNEPVTPEQQFYQQSPPPGERGRLSSEPTFPTPEPPQPYMEEAFAPQQSPPPGERGRLTSDPFTTAPGGGQLRAMDQPYTPPGGQPPPDTEYFSEYAGGLGDDDRDEERSKGGSGYVDPYDAKYQRSDSSSLDGGGGSRGFVGAAGLGAYESPTTNDDDDDDDGTEFWKKAVLQDMGVSRGGGGRKPPNAAPPTPIPEHMVAFSDNPTWRRQDDQGSNDDISSIESYYSQSPSPAEAEAVQRDNDNPGLLFSDRAASTPRDVVAMAESAAVQEAKEEVLQPDYDEAKVMAKLAVAHNTEEVPPADDVSEANSPPDDVEPTPTDIVIRKHYQDASSSSRSSSSSSPSSPSQSESTATNRDETKMTNLDAEIASLRATRSDLERKIATLQASFEQAQRNRAALVASFANDANPPPSPPGQRQQQISDLKANMESKRRQFEALAQESARRTQLLSDARSNLSAVSTRLAELLAEARQQPNSSSLVKAAETTTATFERTTQQPQPRDWASSYGTSSELQQQQRTAAAFRPQPLSRNADPTMQPSESSSSWHLDGLSQG